MPARPHPSPFAGELDTEPAGNDAAPPFRPATRMDPELERELVGDAGTDPSAFGELYDFYLPRIYGFVFRRVRDRAATEDITAMTFQRALETLRRGRFRNDTFGGWLYRVAANAVVDHVRAAQHIQADAQVGEAAATDALAAAIDRDELRKAMDSLSEAHRRVLTLRFFDDLDAEEASSVLGCSRRTFAVKLHRALGALRRAMASDMSAVREATDAA